MDSFEKKKLKLYGLFWAAVFIIPTLPLLWGTLGITGHFSSFEEIKSLWLSILPVFILFIIHNFLVFPLRKHSTILYIVVTVLLVIVFGVLCLTLLDHPPGIPERYSPMDTEPPANRPARSGVLLLGFGVLAIIVNYGGNAMVERQRKEEESKALEIDNLRLQLESLRYQLNPHFFLNTLNNIQALILIDQDKAVESIGVFSKMMQLVLRTADTPLIPLADEICFVDYLTSLMRLRYPGNVSIETDLPSKTGEAVIQPMILGTFLENAFKYGISYEKPSFIKVRIEVRDCKIIFRCENSIHSDRQVASYGIGLENARRRLSLLYGEDYSLDTIKGETYYSVTLEIPSTIDLPSV